MSTSDQVKEIPPPTYVTYVHSAESPQGITHAEMDKIGKSVFSRPSDVFDRECLQIHGYIDKFYHYDKESRQLCCHGDITQDVEKFLNVNKNWVIFHNAQQIVKDRWVKSGIWNQEWDRTGRFDRWPHEDNPHLQASRPDRKFFLQIETEYQWLIATRDVSTPLLYRGSRPDYGGNLLFQVYEAVKKEWCEWEIWNPSWGSMPGKQWRHEEYSVNWGPWENHMNGVPSKPRPLVETASLEPQQEGKEELVEEAE